MNTRRAINDSADPVSLSAAFNQDNSCFSVGLDSGFCGTEFPMAFIIRDEASQGLTDGWLQCSIRSHVSSKFHEVRLSASLVSLLQ